MSTQKKSREREFAPTLYLDTQKHTRKSFKCEFFVQKLSCGEET